MLRFGFQGDRARQRKWQNVDGPEPPEPQDLPKAVLRKSDLVGKVRITKTDGEGIPEIRRLYQESSVDGQGVIYAHDQIDLPAFEGSG